MALLQTHSLVAHYGDFQALFGVDIELAEAETIAIIGANGAGKTTFMDIVTGKTRPDSGAVRWGDAGSSLLRKSEAQIAQLGIGRKFQKPTTFETQSVYDNLLMALYNKRSPFSVLTYARNKVDEAQISQIASQINLQESLSR